MTNYYYFTEQPYTGYNPDLQEQYPALRLTLPNSNYDPQIASDLYNRYHDEYQVADDVGLRWHHDQRASYRAVLHASLDQYHRHRAGEDHAAEPHPHARESVAGGR